MQFTTDKRAFPILIITFILSLILILYSFWGHIQVYGLRNAGSIEAIAQSTYEFRTSTRHNGRTRYVDYTYSVEGVSYEGKSRTTKYYSAGESVEVYYMYQTPGKSGLLKINLPILLLGLAFCVISLVGIRNFIKHFR